jgi:hypothetical protein
MQLIQIGAQPQKTVLDFIHEMSERQSYEIEQLKRSACARAERRRNRAKRVSHSKQGSSSSS